VCGGVSSVIWGIIELISLIIRGELVSGCNIDKKKSIGRREAKPDLASLNL
jgi:hypothetical protein